MPEPIKIAYVIDTIATPSAGTEKQLLYLLNGLNRDKISPYLVCFYQSEWMESQTFDFPVYYINLRSFLSADFFKAYKLFKDLHKQQKFDIVQTFFKDGNIFGTIAAHFAKVPKIISSRRNIGYWHNKFQITILRFLQKWTTYYLANSQAAVDMTIEIEHADKKKFHIIYNGLDLKRFQSIERITRQKQREIWKCSEDDIVIGTVANLRPVKRLHTVIETAKKLIPQYQNLKFICIGEGSDRKHLENLISSYNLTEYFFLPGSSEDIPSVLSGFDIALLPSSNESFSNSLIEYMASSLPIIATKVGGNSEAITHDENGLLYSLENQNGLTESLKIILDKKEKAHTLSEHARKKAFAEYSIEKMIQNHEQFYQSVI